MTPQKGLDATMQYASLLQSEPYEHHLKSMRPLSRGNLCIFTEVIQHIAEHHRHWRGKWEGWSA